MKLVTLKEKWLLMICLMQLFKNCMGKKIVVFNKSLIYFVFSVRRYLGRMLRRKNHMIRQGSFKMFGHHHAYHGLNP
jgi:hypothetical protein